MKNSLKILIAVILTSIVLPVARKGRDVQIQAQRILIRRQKKMIEAVFTKGKAVWINGL